MEQWVIYGKRTNVDKTFRALDYHGRRVWTLADAGFYDTKEEAAAILEKATLKDNAEFDIRKVNV